MRCFVGPSPPLRSLWFNLRWIDYAIVMDPREPIKSAFIHVQKATKVQTALFEALGPPAYGAVGSIPSTVPSTSKSCSTLTLESMPAGYR